MSKDAATADGKQVDFSEPWSFGDVAFIVEGRSLWANKAILSMWSPVFQAMFGSDFKERNSTEIPLPEKKYNSFRELLCVTHPPNKEISCKKIC